MASIRALMDGGHSKCPKPFYFLEFGTFMIRHLVMIRRLMYHRHILTRDSTEIIKKIYMKQKVNSCKGDWIRLVEKDFLFIEQEIDEDWISRTGKDEYNSYIKGKVKVAAFREYIQLKEKCKKKLKSVHYSDFSIQPYLISNKISLQEKQLLWSLRSKCYPAKSNFSKMNRGNLMCYFQCNSEETQSHIFEHCEPIRARIGYPLNVNLNDIYGPIDDQIRAARVLNTIDLTRRSMKEGILPGGFLARTHVDA
jgi:hypothetical protein